MMKAENRQLTNELLSKQYDAPQQLQEPWWGNFRQPQPYNQPYPGVEPTAQVAESLRLYESGAKRQKTETRLDLACPLALKALGDTLTFGLEKYGLDNWSKGMDIGETLAHVYEHLRQWSNGERDEDHLGHALTGITFLIHFSNYCSCHKARQLMTTATENYTKHHGAASESGKN